MVHSTEVSIFTFTIYASQNNITGPVTLVPCLWEECSVVGYKALSILRSLYVRVYHYVECFFHHLHAYR